MERPTHELLLPDSKVVVILYNYLSGGQFKDLQRQMIDKTNIKIGDMSSADQKENEKNIEDAMKDMTPGFILDQGDLLEKFLIKEIKLPDGTIIPKDQHHQFIYDLNIADEGMLSSELLEIDKQSALSQQQRKK